MTAPSSGFGPLLQRDYWAVVTDCRLRPSEVMEWVAQRLDEFAPEALCRFTRAPGATKSLAVGEVVDIDIPPNVHCQVRVTHRDPQTFTFATLPGHPESGRITFGAYRNERGDVIFHIRSRARSGDGHFYAGFLVLGEAMQTHTWAEFVNRVALTAGEGALNAVHAETVEVSEADAAGEEASRLSEPTFVAKGD